MSVPYPNYIINHILSDLTMTLPCSPFNELSLPVILSCYRIQLGGNELPKALIEPEIEEESEEEEISPEEKG